MARTAGELVAVREAVRDRMRVLGWSDARLAHEAGLSYNAVREFLTGKRDWPRARSRKLMEDALGWSGGTFERLAAGGDPGHVATSTPLRSEVAGSLTVEVVIGFPADLLEGTSELARAEARARAEAAYLRTLLEHRAAGKLPPD